MSKRLANTVSKLRNQVEARADKERREKMAQIQEMQKRRITKQEKPRKEGDD